MTTTANSNDETTTTKTLTTTKQNVTLTKANRSVPTSLTPPTLDLNTGIVLCSVGY